MHLPVFKTFYMLLRSSHLFHVLCKIRHEIIIFNRTYVLYILILRHFVYLDNHKCLKEHYLM